jgi:hypothetical protein
VYLVRNIEGSREQGAEENIWFSEKENNRMMWKVCVMSFMNNICNK